MGIFETPRQQGNRFVGMLEALATDTREAIGLLEAAFAGGDGRAVEALRAKTEELLEQRRILVDELHKTFITPLDREDIYNLSYCYEKMALYALTTLEEMTLLRVAPDTAIRGMVALVHEQAEELESAMRRLMQNPRVACDHANTVHERERRVELAYRGAVRDLFARAASPEALPDVFYRREVYRHVSNMSDRAVSAANVLGMIVMKLA